MANEKTRMLRDLSSVEDDEDVAGGGGGMTVQEFRRGGRPQQRPSISGGGGSLRGSLRASLAESFRGIVDSTFSLPGGRPASIRDFGGHASMASEMATISKNLIGGGVLSLSGGIAMASDLPAFNDTILPSSLWILGLGAVFGYYCWLIGKLCKYTGQVTYRALWQDTVGETGGYAVPAVNAFKAALGNLAYSTILSQTGVSLCASLGFKISRILSLLVITMTLILPLCLLKNLKALAPLSVLGTTGILITAAAMTVRYLDGSYLPGGQFYDDLEPQYVPHFGSSTTTNNRGAWSWGILPFACMTFEAYVMHYNSARLYAELKHTNLQRFGAVVGTSFGFTALVYVAISSIGFLTFGANSNTYILNNYSPADPLATLCRLMVAFSTLITYPIAFIGFRDGVLDLLGIAPERQTEPNLNMLSLLLLTALTVTAIFVTDLGLINAVGGGTLATVMVFVFPTLMYRNLVREQQLERERMEVMIATILMMVGIFLGIVGVYLSVKNAL